MGESAREAALNALMRCRRDTAWSGAAIDGEIKKAKLTPRDAAFASRLCMGVLQTSRLCDFYIDCYSSQSARKLEPKLRELLRLGVYQIAFLDRVPAHAAVSESVSLCKKCGMARAASLVNAVLRRICENKDALPEVPNTGSAEHLAVKYSFPDWMSAGLISERGYDFAEAFMRRCSEPPTLDIQINSLKISAEDYTRALARRGAEFKVYDFPSGCVELPGGNVTLLPGFEEGLFYVQNRAARLAVEIAAPEAGMRVLDACAAPGGKSFAAALRMRGEGSILACDIHEKKLPLIRRGAERLGIEIIDTAARDARVFDKALENSFDVVIADVPCSGLGVAGRKPEIRYKREEDIAALPRIQADILANLARFVKLGGILLYSTCTVFKSENEELVKSFLESYNSFVPDAFTLGDKTAADGMYTFWPNTDGTDGFFAARLKRVK